LWKNLERVNGNRTFRAVVFVQQTSDFKGSHSRMLAMGVKFIESPRSESYGQVAIFVDLYGNKWDLIESK
jgi:predicted methyltransferase MtxX (methanogen marker protein 4)